MQRYTGVAQDTSGNAISSPTVTVYKSGTMTAAAIYATNGTGSPKANPFLGDPDGTFEFYAPSGRYSIVVTKTGHSFDSASTSDIWIGDPDDWVLTATDHGLVPNDSSPAVATANTAAFNALLAGLPANWGGDRVTVYFPPGIYHFNDEVKAIGIYESPLRIRGDSRWSVMWRWNLSGSDPSKAYFTLDGCAFTELENIHIGTSGPPYSYGTGVRIGNYTSSGGPMQGLVFRNVDVNDASEYGWDLGDGYVRGMGALGSNAPVRWYFENCTSGGFHTSGPRFGWRLWSAGGVANTMELDRCAFNGRWAAIYYVTGGPVIIYNSEYGSYDPTRQWCNILLGENAEKLEIHGGTHEIAAEWIHQVDVVNWQASTAYQRNDLVHADGGKVYRCKVPGTSAGSGGPTGTGDAITDNTVTWEYVGNEPSFPTNNGIEPSSSIIVSGVRLYTHPAAHTGAWNAISQTGAGRVILVGGSFSGTGTANSAAVRLRRRGTGAAAVITAGTQFSNGAAVQLEQSPYYNQMHVDLLEGTCEGVVQKLIRYPNPELWFRHPTTSLPDGLWRMYGGSTTLGWQLNAAAAGDFSSAITPLELQKTFINVGLPLRINNAFLRLDEITDPGNPGANKLVLYADVSGGKTRLMARTDTGAFAIWTEP